MSENQWELVGRYLSGEASEEEIKQVESLMESDESFRSYVQDSRWVWKNSEKVSEAGQIDVDAAWQRVSSRLSDADLASSVAPKGRMASMPVRLSRVAAAVIALVMISAIAYFMFNRYPTGMVAYNTAASEIIEVELPDGTLVTLNEGSSLFYDRSFGDKTRSVTLEGEGFFDVVRNEQLPFIVNTESLDVRVLGTSFDVYAYDDRAASVVVATGRVEVEAGDERLELEPGDMGKLAEKDGSLTKSRTDIDELIAWRIKSFTFQDEKLSAVVEKLSETYHMDVNLSEEALKNCRLSATFNKRTLKEVLQIISSTLNVTVEKTPKGYLLSGEGC
ncbi:FecR family protein [Roseivirga sp. BDSF3-8]|uniref:FecR family protein n=1 Tax=Roseivirga sp. BDSF3-8 TaxID=3241598 RepID=UPI0035327055